MIKICVWKILDILAFLMFYNSPVFFFLVTGNYSYTLTFGFKISHVSMSQNVDQRNETYDSIQNTINGIVSESEITHWLKSSVTLPLSHYLLLYMRGVIIIHVILHYFSVKQNLELQKCYTISVQLCKLHVSELIYWNKFLHLLLVSL